MTYMFGLIVIFNVLNKKVGLYLSVIIPHSLFAVSTLVATFIFDSMWTVIIILVIGFGIGFGPARPAGASMAAQFTSVNNRGLLLSIVEISKELASVVGPMIMGYLYELD